MNHFVVFCCSSFDYMSLRGYIRIRMNLAGSVVNFCNNDDIKLSFFEQLTEFCVVSSSAASKFAYCLIPTRPVFFFFRKKNFGLFNINTAPNFSFDQRSIFGRNNRIQNIRLSKVNDTQTHSNVFRDKSFA